MEGNRTADAIVIDKEAFDKAVAETLEYFFESDALEGGAKLIFSMSGAAFAGKLRDKLFKLED
jgi:hypothetical protein